MFFKYTYLANKTNAGLLKIAELQIVTFLLYPHLAESKGENLWGLFCNILISFLRAPPT